MEPSELSLWGLPETHSTYLQIVFPDQRKLAVDKDLMRCLILISLGHIYQTTQHRQSLLGAMDTFSYSLFPPPPLILLLTSPLLFFLLLTSPLSFPSSPLPSPLFSSLSHLAYLRRPSISHKRRMYLLWFQTTLSFLRSQIREHQESVTQKQREVIHRPRASEVLSGPLSFCQESVISIFKWNN